MEIKRNGVDYNVTQFSKRKFFRAYRSTYRVGVRGEAFGFDHQFQSAWTLNGAVVSAEKSLRKRGKI